MKCELCQAEMQQVHDQTHFHCLECNHFHFPDAELSLDSLTSLEKSTDFECPVCPESKLHVAEVQDTQVCFCSNCRGFVIDQSSFGGLVEVLRSAYQGPDDKPAPLDQDDLKKLCMCPVCAQCMDTFAYAGPSTVVLDSCNECGIIWLNYGELGRIVRAPGRREYETVANVESDLLRAKLYAQSEAELTAGKLILGGIFG